MRIEKVKIDLNGHELVLRNAEKEDAAILLPYLKKVCGESRFLMREADEVEDLTLEKEECFIVNHNDSDGSLLVIAELDGKYVGNASFDRCGLSRRTKHRADIGIALYEEFTGRGIGSKLFEVILDVIKKSGFEQAELTVVEGNERAKHMYEKYGFIETGRTLRANKYDDGTYADDIHMIKSMK